MFDANKFKTTPIQPNVFGGLGQGGRIDDLSKVWTLRHCHNDVWVVHHRDYHIPLCFSLKPCSWGGGWDIALYENLPETIWNALRKGKDVPGGQFFESDPLNKYLAIDLKKILDDRQNLIEEIHRRR